MSKKYLVGPFIICLAPWIYGNGTLPLLPLYAIDRGGSQASSGLFLAFAFLCLALGNMAPAMLPKTFHHRRLVLIACGIPFSVLTWLSGRVTDVLQLAIVTGVLWFSGGVLFSQTSTLIGLAAPEKERGTAFGILGMTNGLGMLVGGLAVGYIADRFGYRGVFNALAPLGILIVLGGVLCVEPRGSALNEPEETAIPAANGRPISGLLILLFLAQLIIAVTNGPGNLGRSFSMSAAKFSKSAITSTAALQGLVSLCLPLVMGWLSDRFGRRWMLIVSCAAIAVALVLLGFSRSLWQFFVFAVLFSFFSIPQGIGPSLIVDLDPAGNVGRRVSLYGSMFWIGSIAGMASAGYAIERMGTVTPMLLSCVLPVTSAILLLFVREKSRTTAPAA
jgi:MFS transporter, ACS family, hexuronate transporter